MYVIFGASGKVGRATAIALRNAGRPVRAVVRQAKQGEALAKIGCEIVCADLTDPTTVASAIKGATAVQIGTQNFVDPFVWSKVLDGLADYITRHHVAKLSDLVGAFDPTPPKAAHA